MAEKLLLLRHAETGYRGRFIGSTDVGIITPGSRRIDRVAACLHALEPAGCLGSPMRRAVDTATLFQGRFTTAGIEYLGLHSLDAAHYNLSTPALNEFALRRFEGRLAHLGPLVVSMGQHTGRAAKDKYIVEEPETRDDI